MQKKLYSTAPVQPTAVLVAVVTQRQNDQQALEYLHELEFLAETAGIRTLKKFRQKLMRPHAKTFVGKGKLQEISTFVKAEQPTMVVFDDELSIKQIRNLENELKCKIMDRTMLILEIFLLRAKTAQARTQVELAQLQYMLPRLTRLWSHHSRQQGGRGTRGGPGETELETDRRIVRDKITLLRRQLADIEKQGHTQRKARESMVRVALVGYTNVGKSTLMRLLTKADVFAENKLFATVDSTVRKVVLDNVPFLLTDTVGFIRKLPTTLVESFKSTLSEITEADLLLHVVDISHPAFEEHLNVVNQTLAEIGAADKPVILVFNKIDAYENPELIAPEFGELDFAEAEATDFEPDDEDGDELVPAGADEHLPALAPVPATKMTLAQFKQTYVGKTATVGTTKNLARAVFISATERDNIQELREVMLQEIAKRYFEIYPNFLNKALLPEYVKYVLQPQ
ncbi:MAG: GTPase HflX [Bernardetiaceae bacterium]|nr:GTPase HflX [Bernardetiaceae bacterium]